MGWFRRLPPESGRSAQYLHLPVYPRWSRLAWYLNLNCIWLAYVRIRRTRRSLGAASPRCSTGPAGRFQYRPGLAPSLYWRALASLSSAGVATVELHPFRPGRAFLTPRTESDSLLPLSTCTDETFVPLARGALSALEAEHSLSWAASGRLSFLFLFLLLCDRRGDLAEGEWTKSRLSSRLSPQRNVPL